MNTILGIDVSASNGPIDWQKVAADPQGIKFAYIQASFKDGVNPAFVANVRGALAAGLAVGGYHFAYDAVRPEAAANAFLEAIAQAGGAKRFTLAPRLDYEMSTRSTREIEDWASRWLETVGRAAHWRGGLPGIYSDPGWWDWHAPNLRAPTGPAWVADLTTAAEPVALAGQPAWRFWQFSWTGKVDGIDGPVDMDRLNGTEDQLFARTPAPMPAVKSANPDAYQMGGDVHTVEPGDTLWSIARGWLGSSATNAQVAIAAASIARANPHDDPAALQVGDVLTIPASLTHQEVTRP